MARHEKVGGSIEGWAGYAAGLVLGRIATAAAFLARATLVTFAESPEFSVGAVSLWTASFSVKTQQARQIVAAPPSAMAAQLQDSGETWLVEE